MFIQRSAVNRKYSGMQSIRAMKGLFIVNDFDRITLMNRRTLLSIGLVAAATTIPFLPRNSKTAHAMDDDIQLESNPKSVRPFTLTADDWKSRLSDEAFYVLREEGTERPFTSAHNDEKREGEYHCAGCDLALFEAGMKFDSGTGWPSFWQAIDGRVETKRDFKLILPRTEYHCARCGGHQGHIFKDGPKPTGLRYCNNGIALNFKPA